MRRRFWILALAGIGTLHAGIDLRLPTQNHYLFSDEPERFYMHVDRTFEGETSQPWQGGCYGFVRNPVRIHDQVIQTKFHEGIDIQPLKRDAAGNPLDEVCSIAAGKVAYVSQVAGHSNYGRYVVIEHSWENTPVYSLYAHLASTSCKVGDLVEAGTPIAVLGFTGSGINQIRAHLHLEVTMLMSSRYEEWAKGTINYHGIFNGMNLTGADVARWFLEQQKSPELKFSDFIASTPVYFKVLAPAKGTPEFVERYPWICRGDPQDATSWEISFSATGMPVAFTPSNRRTDAAVVTAVRPSDVPHSYLTRNLITGQGNKATLTHSGQRLVALLTNEFP